MSKIEIEIEDTDESVDEMLKTWDEVICSQCGRKVSMLECTLVNGDTFICKSCINGR